MSWEKVKLIDCCVSIADGDHQPPPKSETGIPFVTIANIVNNQFDFTNSMFVPNYYYEKLDSKRKAQKGDILYSVVGSFGIPVFIKDNKPFVFQRHIAILRPNGNIDARFLYYTMLSRDFYMKADAAAIGAAQRTVSLTALRNIEITVPPIETQRRIADIVSAYDDLIENNRKQIKLLEEAAQRLYKEWFVDLRFPNHEHTKIVDGVPEGWRSGILDDIVSETGKATQKENRQNYDYYLPIDCLPKKSIGYVDTNDIELAESSLVSFDKGDIIFGAMRPYFHKVVVARNKGLTRSTCFVLNSRSENMWGYVAMLLFDSATVEYATQISVGTTMPYVRWKDMKLMPVLIPTNQIAASFNVLIKPEINKIGLLANQISILGEARDRLLPKLMSGDVEV